MDLLSQIRMGGIMYILLAIAITMHEYGHAYVADKLGDKLPRLDGRVTINPLAHMDTLGTVVLPLITIALSMGTGFPMVFGWGKPVRLDLGNPKTRVKVDILSTAGGVGMNLVVALVSAVLAGVLAIMGLDEFVEIAVYSIMINCVLFIINMIPVPPLDGSTFLRHAIKMSDAVYYTLARWGILILLLLLTIPYTKSIILILVRALSSIFIMVAQLISRIGE